MHKSFEQVKDIQSLGNESPGGAILLFRYKEYNHSACTSRAAQGVIPGPSRLGLLAGGRPLHRPCSLSILSCINAWCYMIKFESQYMYKYSRKYDA